MPQPKKGVADFIAKKVAKKMAKKAPAKKAAPSKMSSKAEEYSDILGTKKKGYKIKPGIKGFEDAMPTSNMKVKGRPNSSIAQRTRKGLPSRTAPAPIKPVKGKKGTAKNWGRKDAK